MRRAARAGLLAPALGAVLLGGCAVSTPPQGAVPPGITVAAPAVPGDPSPSADPSALTDRTRLQQLLTDLQSVTHELGALDDRVNRAVAALAMVDPQPCQTAATGGPAFTAALKSVYGAQGGLRSQLPSLSHRAAVDTAAIGAAGTSVLDSTASAVTDGASAELATASQRVAAAAAAIHAAQLKLRDSGHGCTTPR